MAERVDYSEYIGKHFGKLKILSIESKNTDGYGFRSIAFCECECGGKREAPIGKLNAGHVKDCGCGRHGMGSTRFYNIWCGIKGRCENPNTIGFENYGGRGIKICERWHEFENFKRDMHESYLSHVEEHGEDDTSIDRINVNGGYEPSNCRWATRQIQNENSRQVRKYKWNGEFLSLTEIARREGINYRTLRQRFLYNGWELEEAVKTPIHSEKKFKHLKRYDVFGEELTFTEIARKAKMPRATLQSRVEKQGMSIEEAATKPVKKRGVN